MSAVPGDPIRVRTLLDTYGYTADLKVPGASPAISFDFDEVRPIFDGFVRTVRDMEFELSELSTATLLQAHIAGIPLVLLPIGLLSRFHHGSTVRRAGDAPIEVADLSALRIGVRAYTQTTVVWARGILENEYGFDGTAATWVTLEDPHVETFKEPANVERAPAGSTLESLLESGVVDAAIIGRVPPGGPPVATVVPDPETAEMAWYRRTHVLPINHVLVAKRALLDRHPWMVDELGRLFAAGRSTYLDGLRDTEPTARDDRFRRGLLDAGIDPVPMGHAAVRPALELLVDYCVQQGMIPHRIEVDDLFDERLAGWSGA